MKSFTLLVVTILCNFITISGQSGSPWQPFSAESPWNTPIPENPVIHPDSEAMVKGLKFDGLYINMGNYSVPVYYIDSDTVVAVNVVNSRPGIFGVGFREPNQIPVPENAAASGPEDGDNHLCIVDITKNISWDMWLAEQNESGEWSTGLGAMVDLNGTGVSEPWDKTEGEFDAHRARASGFPLLAGLIRVEEVKAGSIEHALGFSYSNCRASYYLPPASTSQFNFGGRLSSVTGIPMGGLIQLDPDIDIDTLQLNAAGKIIARALQKYGAYCGDYSYGTTMVAESSPEAMSEWEGILDNESLSSVFTNDFIGKYFRVIDTGIPSEGNNFRPTYEERADFNSFGLEGVNSNTLIDFRRRIIEVRVPVLTNIYDLAASYEFANPNEKVYVEGVLQDNGITRNNFLYPVIYTIISENNNRSLDWEVKVITTSHMGFVYIGLNEDSPLIIYPNPARDFFRIENAPYGNISIYNAAGSLVLFQNIDGAKCEISTGDLESGVYFVKLEFYENTETRRLIITRY